MYVKEITIDGFKSYAQRVVVPDFDPQFNAITGLNGSGKSNILDSICFVLGITNLQQVRASSLQDLVYKQGQAGVTKATVSIVFDNADKERSPVGYDHLDEITVTRQLVIGGRSKYLINGRVAEPTRVQNLFHSVQLNVNNPHFLIMQGRITKVLNMKPPEVLGLIEEAAGTKMYESKKQAALRTLERKQVKLEEINRVLEEDIMPALTKLRSEKAAYAEWQAASAGLDRLRRLCVAFRYQEAVRLQQDGQAEVQGMTARLEAAERQAADLEIQLSERSDELMALQAEKEQAAGAEVKTLAAKVDDLSKRLVKHTAAWKHKVEAVAAERAELTRLEQAAAEMGEAELAARLAAAEEAARAAEADASSAVAEVSAAQAELAGVKSGDGRDGSGRSMQERLADLRNAQTETGGVASRAIARAMHVKKQLAEKQKALQAQTKAGSRLSSELEKARAEAARAEAAAGDGEPLAEVLAAAAAEAQASRREAQRLRNERDDLAAGLASVDFKYTPPERGFDAGRVKGVVARLVRVRDPATATALEVAAGGRLYQVVVDADTTAKSLLARGGLRQRVTIIPLNKVVARDLAPGVVQAAKAAAGDRASPALELVGYADELGPAMRYAFGGTFVCRDAATAKHLAFSREVRMRCVTLEGDEFNPAGTLTGGSRGAAGGGVLSRLHSLQLAEEKLAAAERQLREAESKHDDLRERDRQSHGAVRARELARHALQLLEQRAASSEEGQLSAAVAALERELSEAEAERNEATAKKERLEAQASELQARIRAFDADRAGLVKAAEKRLKDAKKQVDAAKSAAREASAALAGARAETESADKERQELSAGIASSKTSIDTLESEELALAQAVASLKTEHDAAAEQLGACKARLADCDAEIAAAKKVRAALESQLSELGLANRKLASSIEACKKGARESGERQAKLEREYPWIASERAHFGKPGTDYDFAGTDPEAAYSEYEQAEGRIETLGRKVNKKVMAMFDKAESEYNELKRKRDVVQTDKLKIQEVMEELDEKKRQALETTWKKVNADFGAIFSTLLPGTTAKLEPPEGESFVQGLEVRVAFGGVWKESLSELSGGQKSLLALSLILAMLLFKPAPIYILDEVDAALDLSHTQNIGRMIKAHFPQSQFIVVSLKEGMFSNANVLFRTSFVDGVSNVTRTTPNGQQAGGARSKAGAGAAARAPLRENIRA